MPIEVRDLSFTYAQGSPFEAKALNKISLSIADGDFVGLIGKTGCGKSTLVQLLAALMKPASGTVLLDGEDVFSAKYDRVRLRQRIGVLFQYPDIQLFENTVEKDVAFALKHSSLKPDEVKERTRWALDAVGLDFEQTKDLFPLSLSGGEKRRVAIAGVLVSKPDILILDEPIAGLDPNSHKGFLDLLDQLNAQGTTIVMISHNLDALAEHTRRIIVLEDGKLIRDSSTRDVLADVQFLRSHSLGMTQVGLVSESLKNCDIHFEKCPLTMAELCSALREVLV